jgi:cell division protein FtsQ
MTVGEEHDVSVETRVSTDPRISRRRKSVARSRRRRWLIAAAAVAGVALLIWTAFWSPLLAVRHVRLVGAEHTTAGAVAAAAQLSTDDNLLLVSTSEIARKAETLPWVRAAEVDRKLPGTVVVHIEERRPAMVLSVDAGRWTIDGAGHVLGRASESHALPILSGFDPGQVRPGMSLGLPQARAAMKVWRSLPAGLADHVVALFAPTPLRVSLSLDTSTTVRYGSASATAAKNAVLKALLARARAQGSAPAYIDVRVPESPAVSSAPVATALPSPGASPTASASPAPSPSASAR